MNLDIHRYSKNLTEENGIFSVKTKVKFLIREKGMSFVLNLNTIVFGLSTETIVSYLL